MEGATLEWISNGNLVLGFLLALFTAIATIASWFWSRITQRVDVATSSAVKKAAQPTGELTRKVSDIERDVDEISEDVGEVKAELQALSSRVQHVERGMETVARQKDVAELNAEVKELGGSVRAELRMLSGIMHTFREAALRAADRGETP